MMPRFLLLAFFGLAGIPFAIGVVMPDFIQFGIILTLLVSMLAIFDIILTPSLRKIEIGREVGEVMSVGAKNPVKIWIKNRNRRSIRVHIHDEPPQPCTVYDLPFHIRLTPGSKRTVTYHVKPHHRGKNSFGMLFLETRSLFGLWTFHNERYTPHDIRVFPDIQAVHKVELLARQNRLAEAGVRMSRLKGRGSEFDRLREYRREDEYRSIDWKATARHRKLVSREYVVEKNQNILFLLDCGRSMANELDGISHFDRALNAAILLSYVALRQGDTVGMMVCSNKVERWVAPVRGLGAVRKLVGLTYDINPSYAASDYGLMVQQLRSRYRKRSLVVMLTHALDEVHMEAISTNIRQLKKPHLVLGAFLRNVPLHNRLEEIPKNDLDAFQIAAAAEMISTQTLQITQLEKTGVLVRDTLPEDLSATLISNYLEIKARHLL